MALLAASVPGYPYEFWRYDAGREDFGNGPVNGFDGRYDPNGIMWPSVSGTPLKYNFGDFVVTPGFAASIGLTDTVVTNAVSTAGAAWEKWLNVDFGNMTTTVSPNSRLFLEKASIPYPAATYPTTNASQNLMDHATIKFAGTAGGGKPWTADNFQWTFMHELGHVLGIYDLYISGSEEFVDHPVIATSANLPDARVSGCIDNVMDRINGATGGCYDTLVNDYSKPATTIIDNDEIAGGAWLWGSPYNQLVTGGLDFAWTGDTRTVRPHHGDQLGSLGGWEYRGTVATAGSIRPYVDLEFPGYVDFTGRAFTDVPIIYGGNQGGDIERFIIDQVGWVGNFDLIVRSEYITQGYISARIIGGREDDFVLTPSTNNLTFNGIDRWAAVFGPLRVPEPATPALMMIGLLVLAVSAKWKRSKRCTSR